MLHLHAAGVLNEDTTADLALIKVALLETSGGDVGSTREPVGFLGMHIWN